MLSDRRHIRCSKDLTLRFGQGGVFKGGHWHTVATLCYTMIFFFFGLGAGLFKMTRLCDDSQIFMLPFINQIYVSF